MLDINGNPIYQYNINGIPLLSNISMAMNSDALAVIVVIAMLLAGILVAVLIGYGFWKLTHPKKPTH